MLARLKIAISSIAFGSAAATSAWAQTPVDLSFAYEAGTANGVCEARTNVTEFFLGVGAGDTCVVAVPDEGGTATLGYGLIDGGEDGLRAVIKLTTGQDLAFWGDQPEIVIDGVPLPPPDGLRLSDGSDFGMHFMTWLGESDEDNLSAHIAALRGGTMAEVTLLPWPEMRETVTLRFNLTDLAAAMDALDAAHGIAGR